MKQVLYAKDSRGDLRFWSIEKVMRQDGAHLVMEYGQVGGESIFQTEEIEENLSGRGIEEQADLRFNRRLTTKLRAGYVRDKEQAKNTARVNSLGLIRPMTAKKYKDRMEQIDIERGWFIQRKYNGYRCMAKNKEGDVIPYSRNSVQFNLPHIMDELAIPDGVTLDGELYCHGYKLQQISSWVRKQQPETKNIWYNVYDLHDENNPDMPYRKRVEMLERIALANNHVQITMAATEFVNCHQKVSELTTHFIEEGYEGAMLRDPDSPYKSNRSNGLIKVKRFEDGEFLIVDVFQSKDGLGMFWCLAENGKRFKVTAPGNRQENAAVLEDKQKYIGRHLEVEFAERTIDKKPFHCVAKGYREKESE